MKLLIRQGRLVDPVGGIGGVLDILIEDGKVAVIGSDLRSPGAQIIDAKGLTVCAGLVDMHVHLREPGFEYKETIATGARAAAAGGFTAIACMPNTRPVIDIPEGVAFIKEKSAQAGGAQVFPIAAVSKGQKGQEVNDFEALKAAGAVALSDDGVPVQNANLMRDAMIRAKRQELPVLCHCEDTSMVEGRAVNEGSVSRQLWLEGRPAIAEELEVMRAAMLADLLEGRGFRADVKDDSLFAVAEGFGATETLKKTRLLGYLLIHSRQVDMIMLESARAEALREKMAGDMAALAETPLNAGKKRTH